MSEQWKQTELGKVCEIILGQSPSSDTYNQDRIGLPFFQGKSEFGTKYAQAKTWCSEPLKIANKNDILISVRAPVGESNLAPDYCCIGRGLSALRADQKNLLQEFLWHQIEFKKNYLQGISQGSTFDAISGKDLSELEIDIPPLPEQKKIAEILSGIDKSIRRLRLKKEKVKFAKSATSRHIFKSPKDSEQTATQVSDLQSLASIPISYGVLVPDNVTRDEGVPMIKIQDINQGKIQTEKLSYISRTLHDKYAKTEVKTGDLLISLIGSIGITARVPDALQGANVSRQFAVIRTSSPGISDYLHCFLGGAAAQEKISFLSQGNAQKALNLDSLRGLEVPLKSNTEMDRVVRICQALDLTIESISKQIDKAEKIRISVISDLLSGRKRVII
ncbi:restriction endonuclease subunit S [Cyanobium sp. BA5m-21]|uniref:restriction endonuclease subunit S n=1 Tax=unclassified Cyanobium TaxID=2627006 RepID=UPI0020CC288F|nr:MULTISPECIES: restriction endonuclease subunit S [unclassified Cyanobium]MCP9903158.1 restriction endonuclease subunit S [Cyanobium sp. BA5m-10]MCP9907892.1 restriction endonuclease subunit S [Cyanobium sp. BA5m-21]